MAALNELSPIAHGGTTGLAIEIALAGLIVAIALAAWVGARKDKP